MFYSYFGYVMEGRLLFLLALFIIMSMNFSVNGPICFANNIFKSNYNHIHMYRSRLPT